MKTTNSLLFIVFKYLGLIKGIVDIISPNLLATIGDVTLLFLEAPIIHEWSET